MAIFHFPTVVGQEGSRKGKTCAKGTEVRNRTRNNRYKDYHFYIRGTRCTYYATRRPNSLVGDDIYITLSVSQCRRSFPLTSRVNVIMCDASAYVEWRGVCVCVCLRVGSRLARLG